MIDDKAGMMLSKIDDRVELYCQGCESVIRDSSALSERACPECSGSLVGVRLCRSALTGRVLYAERIEF